MSLQTQNPMTDTTPVVQPDTDSPTSAAPFFRKTDWWVFWVTFAVSMIAYFHTIAPTVTLEDSGELTVASDYLGVPHPPGYPIWTLVTWFFQWIFHWVKYYGQPDSNWMLVWRSIKDLFDPTVEGYPNPAWSVALCSAFFGALASGLMAMLMSRSGSDLLRSVRAGAISLTKRTENLITGVCAITGGLLFTFSSVLWSQSTIVEVYAMNAFFMALVVLLTYRWMCRPNEHRTLFVTSFIFGLGLTNHQVLVFLGPALLAAMWFRDRALFWDSMCAICWLVAGLMIKKLFDIDPTVPAQAALRPFYTVIAIVTFLAPGGIMLFVQRKLLPEWKRLAACAGLAFLGVSFYFGYMPVSSEQNPPMNWGYPRTTEGFWHAVSRGQYEKISVIDNIKDAIKAGNQDKFPRLVWKILFDPDEYTSVVSQFALAPDFFSSLAERIGFPPLVAVSAIIPMLCLLIIPFLPGMAHRARDWLIVSGVAFFFLTFVFIIFQYPTLDVQQLFIGRVQYIQPHAIMAVWIAYALMLILAWLDKKVRGNGPVMYLAAAGVAVLPIIPVGMNAYDDQYIEIVGGAEQNQHDFGWQFGAWQLEGARAILHDIGPEEAKTFPNPAYPPPMETNAIFFGGTDPGRFVPTYMIYSAHYREDVYLITQNALADNTYMNVMRDLYGDRIVIPSQQDSNDAFRKYVDDVQSGRIPAGAEVSFEGGRVSVQGVAGVMTINGILARRIFDCNRYKHAFYVEESYVIPWMYEFLEPHGLIMKLNRNPVQITGEMIKNDREFWDWNTKRLMERSEFIRDVVARKTFSKLRGAIAGIYAARRMYPEAEYAFAQAIRLYPLSPEANFRLADIYMQQGKLEQARKVIEDFLHVDEENDRVRDFLKQIVQQQTISLANQSKFPEARGVVTNYFKTEAERGGLLDLIARFENLNPRRQQLEASLQKGGDVNAALELGQIYLSLGLQQQADGLYNNIAAQPQIPPQITRQIADMYRQIGRSDRAAEFLTRYLTRQPKDIAARLDLAEIMLATKRINECMEALRLALEAGGPQARSTIGADPRFQVLRQIPDFDRAFPRAQQQQIDLGLPFSSGFPGMNR